MRLHEHARALHVHCACGLVQGWEKQSPRRPWRGAFPLRRGCTRTRSVGVRGARARSYPQGGRGLMVWSDEVT